MKHKMYGKGKGGYPKAKESGASKPSSKGKQTGQGSSGYGAEASCPSSTMKQQGKESY